MKIKHLTKLPYGSVVLHRNKHYWKSKGLDGDILTDTNGSWQFIKDIKWKSFLLVLWGHGK